MPPGNEQPDDADRGADQPPRLEQIERQHLGGECRRHVEAAAVFVEIDEGQRARVGEARAVKLEQQVAVLRMGIVVPAEAVVAEGHPRDDGDRREDQDRDAIGRQGHRPHENIVRPEDGEEASLLGLDIGC